VEGQNEGKSGINPISKTLKDLEDQNKRWRGHEEAQGAGTCGCRAILREDRNLKRKILLCTINR